MTVPGVGESRAVDALRAASASSRAVALAKQFQAKARARTPTASLSLWSAADDEAAARLGDSSLFVALLERPAARLADIWRDSRTAGWLARWFALPLETRIRLGAIAAIAALVTHLVLTGFSAPEPVTAARVTWMIILALLGWLSAHAREAAAAWTDRAARRAGSRTS